LRKAARGGRFHMLTSRAHPGPRVCALPLGPWKKADARQLPIGKRILGGCSAFWRLIFQPSIHTFFFWSFCIYLVSGLLVLVTRPAAEDFFCKVRPQAARGGRGCENCSSKLLLCDKPACWMHANNVTFIANATDPAGSVYQDFQDAATDVTCNGLITSDVNNPLEMVVAVKREEVLQSTTVTTACRKYHCGVLRNALIRLPDLNSWTNECTNFYGSKPGAEASVCPCAGMLKARADGGYWNPGELETVPQSSIWGTSSVWSVSTGAIFDVCGGAPFLQEMQAACANWTAPAPAWCPVAGVTATTGSATTTDSTTAASTSAAARRLEDQAEPMPTEALPSGEVRQQRPAGTDDSGGILDAEASRRLQTTAAGLQNSDLQDYEAGPWGRCTCYQQCTRGVRTRLVECLAEQCKSPKPADRESCICAHCAGCDVDLRLLVFMCIYFLQAAVAFYVFILYVRVLHQTEDDFVKLRLSMKCKGFFYKQLPPLLRVLVLLQLVQLLWLLFDTWLGSALQAGIGDLSKDCIASKDLCLCTVATACLWLFQVVMGRCTKQHSRKPDWLYAPERDSRVPVLKHLRRCFRCLGP